MKVSEASGHVLDWMVAKALGLRYRNDDKYGPMCFRPSKVQGSVEWDSFPLPYSTDWAHGGPILDKLVAQHNGFCFLSFTTGKKTNVCIGDVLDPKSRTLTEHDAPLLVSLMRGFVIAELGYEVEVPKELL